MTNYYPEGILISTVENKNALKSIFTMQEAMIHGKILEARAIICDNEHNLLVDLPAMKGIIPRTEGAIGIDDGTIRDIALIAKVNKPVCFKILEIKKDENGQSYAILSRKAVQEECTKEYIEKLVPGDIIDAKVTHLEQFGCFVDVACGIPSLVPIDAISVSRISHPSDRFFTGQNIRVIIKAMNNGRIWLSHKELLGTWEDNAEQFKCGETVAGIVRSVEDYGIFVELAPNLAGLAEIRENVKVGQHASVYIKAIIPEKMKVKLIIVDVFDAGYSPTELQYYNHECHISHWKYSTEQSNKVIETYF
ncbi:MAG: S1 RNA-binding domain-containing protein [Oscillospiraceae bacterium]